jgi:hypothetical protein
MPDEPLLDVPPAVEIQMKINGSGLDIVMAQMVLDVRYPQLANDGSYERG